MNRNRNEEIHQILGRVRRQEFVGRAAELETLVAHATRPAESRGLLILLAPLAGVSELLRQAYDELFNQRQVVPIYFALPQDETTAVSAAIEFLNAFLLQYIAYVRDEPSLCQASLTLNDLVQLAPAGDLDWIEALIDAYSKQRFGNDDRQLVRFCLTAPRRVPADRVRPFVMLDATQLAAYADSALPLATEITRSLMNSNSPFALAGLRREVVNAVERAGGNTGTLEVIRLERLEDEDARALLTSAARRQHVAINDTTRDLLVQQLEGSPFFMTAMLQAAREQHQALESYVACERLYVDELLGGRLNRYFTSLLEQIAPEPEIRATLVRLFCEAVPKGNRTASVESWRKRLRLEAGEVERILSRLHALELVNRDGEMVDAEAGPIVWKDLIRSRFRLDVLREPRALVVADVMASALKRAPQTITLHYRRAASLHLRELLGKFNFQRVPSILFRYDQFASLYKGATTEEIVVGLETDTNLTKLPQVFHTASGASFSTELRKFGEESSAVAHAFDGTTYTDANELVWLVAKIDSKLEADRTLAETWCNHLENLARKSSFARTQIWLIANEGFSGEATDLLHERGAYGSSQQQFELLTTQLGEVPASMSQSTDSNEIVMILPMDEDFELLAASTAEQIARRLNFRPEAINQIKTAIVEACINAAEHSLSPDRKIYQRFRAENDKLVITIASRGIVPSNLSGYNRERTTPGDIDSATEERRGWGLKLIKALMDEVEFERVDEGASLRMTKYLRNSP